MIIPSEPKYGVNYHHIKLRAMMFETQIVDCQSTAFFMQYLAELAAASGRGIEIFESGITTAVIPVYFGGKFGIAAKYSPQFSAFVRYGSYIGPAHLQLSYYLLAQELTERITA